MTGWTDARIDLLTRLWLDGRSASQIAAELGGGITRNAVIGKVHRLGLKEKRAGRAAKPKSDGPAPTVVAAPRPAAAKAAVASRPIAPPPTIFPDGEKGRADPAPLPSGSVTILGLRDSMCRWPLGDPKDEGFRYCGARATEVVSGALVYCALHGSMAFQPSQERRRAAPAQRHPTAITAAA